MKIQWSAFFSILALATFVGCGSEQFGTTPQSTSPSVDPLRVYEQYQCITGRDLISPKVDIIYVVDNSGSSFDIQGDVKTAVKNTINSISAKFDYRVIGTTLLVDRTDTNPYDDYRVITNSQTDTLPAEGQTRRVYNPDDLTFFANPITTRSTERGLGRTVEFMNHHRGTGLLRQGAYHLVVLVSNGRDDEVEYLLADGVNTTFNGNYGVRLQAFQNLKTSLGSQQLRFMAVTAKTACSGSKKSENSYIKMANELYTLSGATDNNSYRDSYDVCSSGLSSLFTAVNSSIKEVIIPHTYRYWPVSFAKASDTENSFQELQVFKISNGSSQFIPKAQWTWTPVPSGALNIREPGAEVVAGYHFIRFNSLVTYPDCIQIKTKSRVEYFGYVVLQRKPKPETLYVTINGRQIPQSATDGWTYRENITVPNIKMPYPNPGDELPAVPKSGYMIQFNGSNNYYKSGDDVQVNYIPAAI